MPSIIIDWVQDHFAISIGIGTAMIAIGGLLATLGWEGRSASTARRAVLEVVATELQANEALLSHAVFTETDPEKLKVVRVIPAFNDSALRAAISSGVLTHRSDPELLDAVAALENSIIYFRQFTEVYHGFLLRTASFSNEDQREKEFRKLWLGLRDAAALAAVERNIQTLRAVIDDIEPEIVPRSGWITPEETLPPPSSDEI